MKLPQGEPLRYLLAGGFNTVFGFINTLGITWVFVHLWPDHPVIVTSAATACATILNITLSFSSYKLFVFRTKGNWTKEYLRSMIVYLPTLLIGTTAIAPLTALFRHVLPVSGYAPYAAQICLIVFSVVTSFLGHRHVTFKKDRATMAPVGVTEVE